MEDDKKQWFVVHTYSGYEERVKKNLEQRIKSMDTGDDISQVVIPTENEIEVKNGQRRTVTKKILPGYVLVEMKLRDESWSLVRNTPGVTGFVGSGNKPTPLAEEEVERIFICQFMGGEIQNSMEITLGRQFFHGHTAGSIGMKGDDFIPRFF